MKIKYIIFAFICFVFAGASVYASSIEYNLTIDDDGNFKENNIYKVKSSELKKTGNYDFMTSIVNDKVYFNEDRKVEYNKTKKKSNGVYTITLKNEYSSSFLNGSRIIQECFSKYDFNDATNITISTSSPFYCYSRADSITINIMTNLEVLNNNAEAVNGNTYTWHPTSRDFTLEFGVKRKEITNDGPPMDDIPTEDQNSSSDTTTGDNSDTNTEDNTSADTTKEKKPVNLTVVGIASGVIIFIIIMACLILKQKKNSLNKI